MKIKKSIYKEIRNIIEQARSKSSMAVNTAMVHAYWHIGRVIVEEEQKGRARAEYGTHLIIELSKKMTEDFGKGYDPSNLRYMRLFYLSFPKRDAVRHKSQDEVQNQPPFHPELSWTHYRLLLKVERKAAKDFYINECVENSWGTRQLERQINSFYYERILASRDKKAVKNEANPQKDTLKPQDIIKDPYVLEFLNLKENNRYIEKDLEKGLIEKLQEFLLELGRGFAFVARQKRITAEEDHFYIDLVFYNYLLKCFVLIDLKIGKLTHKDIGQMDFYVRYYENEIRGKSDNPTIGIILCSEKNETVVKYSVLEESKQLFASKYKLYLPTEKELISELENEIIQLKLQN